MRKLTYLIGTTIDGCIAAPAQDFRKRFTARTCQELP